MATKKKSSRSTKGSSSRANSSKQLSQTELTESYGKGKQQLWAIILFVLGILLFCITVIPGQSVWNLLHKLMYGVFGLLAVVLPLSIIYIAIMYTMEKTIGSIKHKLWQAGVLVALICAAAQVFGSSFEQDGVLNQLITFFTDGVDFKGGGLVGGLIGWPLTAGCGVVGARIIVALLIFLFAMILTGSTLLGLFKAITKPYKRISEKYVERVEERKAKFDIDVDLGPDSEPMPSHPVYSESSIDIPLDDEQSIKDIKQKKEKVSRKQRKLTQENEEIAQTQEEESHKSLNELLRKQVDVDLGEEKITKEDIAKATEEVTEIVDSNNQTRMFEEDTSNQNYVKPPISLLKKSTGASSVDVKEELNQNADKLVKTLKSFGVDTTVIAASRGPTVTRYELQPSAGVKISRITGLADDIALNLAAAGVRIEAPIPNKPAVGIEVPNKAQDMVLLRDIIESTEFENAKGNLTVSLGKDIGGKCCVADLAKMPHLLIAGTTGSGKSVCVNTFIMSLIYKSSPDDVKLLLIDPKLVEFGIYEGIPHLLIPVVTDPKKAAGALSWAVTEMLKRYKTFADNSVRDLQGFNELARVNPEIQKMPQIVIIIDELADLMMAASKEVEDSICRLAQMARAAGMHLLVATQRPTVDVITGLIKANIPSRIGFKVTSQIDSRTILDVGGADKLLGRGDMLYYPVGYPKPVRIQGCFVSEKEVEQVVTFIKNKQSADYDEQVIEEIDKQAISDKDTPNGNSGGGFEEEDEMIPAAIKCILEAGQASTSFLQRRLRLGYARAGRIIDILEERGIIGPPEGSKPRQVLITRQQYIEMTMNNDSQVSIAEESLPNNDEQEI